MNAHLYPPLTCFLPGTALAAVASLLLAPSSAEASRPVGATGAEVAAAAFRASGATTQGEPLSLSISARVTRVSRFEIDWRASCPSGRQVAEATDMAAMPIRGSGGKLTFRSSGTYSFPLGDGSTAIVRGNLFGRFVQRVNLRGTWSATYSVVSPDGQPVETCTTGTVRWRGSVH